MEEYRCVFYTVSGNREIPGSWNSLSEKSERQDDTV